MTINLTKIAILFHIFALSLFAISNKTKPTDIQRFDMIESIMHANSSIENGHRILQLCIEMEDKQPSIHLRRTSNWFVSLQIFLSISPHSPITGKFYPEPLWQKQWQANGGPSTLRKKLIELKYLSKDGSLDQKPRINPIHYAEILQLYKSVMKTDKPNEPAA